LSYPEALRSGGRQFTLRPETKVASRLTTLMGTRNADTVQHA
jgi:hypothetical protein